MENTPLYIFTDDVEFIIATDKYDALGQWCAAMGEDPNKQTDVSRFEETVPADSKISVWCFPDGKVAPIQEPGSSLVTKTAQEWIAERGPGYFCCIDS